VKAFSGDDNRKWEDWMKMFRKMCGTYRWSDADGLERMPEYLEGSAYTTWEYITKHNKGHDLGWYERKFAESIGQPIPSNAVARIAAMQQRPDETRQKFFFRFMTIVDEFKVIEKKQLTDQELVDYFITGLRAEAKTNFPTDATMKKLDGACARLDKLCPLALAPPILVIGTVTPTGAPVSTTTTTSPMESTTQPDGRGGGRYGRRRRFRERDRSVRRIKQESDSEGETSSNSDSEEDVVDVVTSFKEPKEGKSERKRDWERSKGGKSSKDDRRKKEKGPEQSGNNDLARLVGQMAKQLQSDRKEMVKLIQGGVGEAATIRADAMVSRGQGMGQANQPQGLPATNPHMPKPMDDRPRACAYCKVVGHFYRTCAKRMEDEANRSQPGETAPAPAMAQGQGQVQQANCFPGGASTSDNGRSPIKCYNCQGYGHISRECPEKTGQPGRPRDRGQGYRRQGNYNPGQGGAGGRREGQAQGAPGQGTGGNATPLGGQQRMQPANSNTTAASS
jgi:hypothetical protein